MPQVLNEVEHSYLTMTADYSLRDHFELRMLEENRIDGLMRLSVCDDDKILKLHYDVTGLESLAELTAQRKLKAQDIRCIILTLKHVITGIEPYLLEASGIRLSMETIYASPVSFAPCFLYFPGQDTNFGEALTDFLQTLLTWTDHDDDASVVLAYRLYRESLDHPSALDRLEQILVSQENSTPAFGMPPVDDRLNASNGFSPEAFPPQSPPVSSVPVAENAAGISSDPLVSEIREVPAGPDDAAALPDTGKGGLFHRLFQ